MVEFSKKWFCAARGVGGQAYALAHTIGRKTRGKLSPPFRAEMNVGRVIVGVVIIVLFIVICCHNNKIGLLNVHGGSNIIIFDNY